MPSPRPRRRRARRAQRGTLLLAGAFAVLIAANVYYFGFRRGTSVRDLVRLSQDKELAALAIQQAQQAKHGAAPRSGNGAKANTKAGLDEQTVTDVDAAASGRVVSGTVPEAGTLATLLRAESVPPGTIAQVAAALRPLFDPHQIRAGQSYTLRFDDEDRLSALEYRLTPVTLYRVERGAKEAGPWRAVKETAPLDVKVVAVAGTVESSLYDAVKKSGEGTALVATLIDLFAWDINFYTDTQPGDRFRLLVEKQYLGERFYKYGRVLAAEYSGRAGTWRAFWHVGLASSASSGEGGAYFDEQGRAVAKSMLKTPLKYVRVSSRFDRHRFHPILHTERAHLGVDYAAPVGTPVWATTNGKVRFRGKRGGAGNCVIIAHPGGMESIYMHLSRFASGLHEGQSVRQKQVIGYVGQTGLATGPHLHFSVKMGGHYVDPLRLKPAREAPLPASERERFQAEVRERLAALAQAGSTSRSTEPGEALAP